MRFIASIFFGCGSKPLVVNNQPKYSTCFCMKKGGFRIDQ
jgi:hypothetical protein